MTLSTALSGESTVSEVYKDASDAAAGAVDLAGSAASTVTEQYQSAIRLQNMTGQVWGQQAHARVAKTLSTAELDKQAVFTGSCKFVHAHASIPKPSAVLSLTKQ